MGEKLEAKSINGRLIDAGYFPVDLILDGELIEKLPRHLLDKEREKYLAIRIIPGEYALKGSGLSLISPSHVVYARFFDTGHPEDQQKPVLTDDCGEKVFLKDLR